MLNKRTLRSGLLTGSCFLASAILLSGSALADKYTYTVGTGTTQTITDEIDCLVTCPSPAVGVDTMVITGGGTLYLANPANTFKTTGYTGINVLGGSTLAIDTDTELGSGGNLLQLGDTTSGVTNANNTLKFLGNTTIATTRGNITLGNGAQYFDTGDFTDAIAGKMRGGGALHKIGNGTLILESSASNYSGGTFVDAGTLQFFDATQTAAFTTGSAWKTSVAAGATVAFGAAGAITNAQIISGAGNLRVTGTGSLILTGTDTYTGQTIVDAGATLQIGANAAAGSIATTSGVLANGTLAFYRNDKTLTFAVPISGTGVVQQKGGGILLLTGNSNAFTGTVLASAGTVQIGDATHATVLGGSVTNNSKAILFDGTSIGGSLINNSGGTATVGNNVSIGGLANATGGSVNIGNAVKFTDVATNNGTVVVGASGTSSSITFNADFTNNNSFTDYGGATFLGNAVNSGAIFRFSDNVAVTGQLSNYATGVLTGTNVTAGNGVANSGSMSLNSLTVSNNGLTNSGTLTTTGDLNVTGAVANSGTLTVGGTATFTGNVTNNGAVTVANAGVTGTLTNNGTLSISGADNVVTVTGNYVQNSSGTLYVNLSSAGSSLLNVSGAASLSGLVDLTVTGVIVVPKEYTIINAGSLSGAFSLTQGKSNGVSYTVEYVGNTVKLSVTPDGLHSVAKGQTLTLADAITGTTSVIAYGGGTLVLTNTSNDYTGYTIVANNSTLQIDAASELGHSKVVMIGDGNDAGTLALTSDMTIDASHQFTLNAGNETIDTGSHTVTIASAIGGNGTLVKAGTGALILTSASDYSTDMKVSAGTLQFGDGSALDMSVSGDIVSNADLVFYSGGTVSVSGALTGTGVVYQKGTGKLIMNATDGFSVGAVVSSGTLQLGNGGLSDFQDSAAISIASGTQLVFNSQGTITLSGAVSGAGDVHQGGSGTLVVTGDQTYTGVTYVDAGTLQIGNKGTTGSLASQSIVFGSATNMLAFNRTDAYTYSGAISGAGGVNVLSGTVVLTGANTYTGLTTVYDGINGATLQIGAGGTTGAVAGNIAVSGALDSVTFKRSDNVTYAGTVSGLGTLQQAGSGTLTLTGANSVSNVTIAAGGTVALSGSGSFINGSVTTTTTTTSTTTTDGVTTTSSPSYKLATAVPATTGIGTATDTTVSKTDALTGIITNTRTQTYTNGASGTLVTVNGTLDVSGVVSPDGGTTVASLAGSGSVVLGGNTLFIYDSAALGSAFSGVISGNGGLTVLSGREYLTGENTYTGDTTIGTGATLYIGNNTSGGSIASARIINNGSLSINRTSPLTISSVISGVGSLSMGRAGLLVLTANNTYTGATTVNVGSLQIGDDDHLSSSIAGSVNVFASSSATTGTATKLIAGGVGGVQKIGGSLTLGQPGSYYNNLAGMTATYAVTVGKAGVSQLNVAGAVTIAGDTEVDVAVEGIPAQEGIYKILTGQSITGSFTRGSGASNGVAYAVYYPSSSPAEVDLLVAPTSSGEIYGDLMTATAQNIHALNSVAFDKAAFERCEKPASGKSADCKGWTVWSKAVGGVGSQDGSNGADGFNTHTVGAIGGIGYNFDDVNSLSAAVAYTNGRVAASGNRQGDKAETDGVYVSLGGHTSAGGIVVDANGFFGGYTSDVTRIAGVGNRTAATLKSSYTGWTAQVGYPVLKGDVTPFARVSYVRLINGTFSETGNDLFGLMGKHGSYVSSTYDIGVRASRTYTVGDGWVLKPHILVAFEESGDSSKEQTPQFEMGLVYSGSYNFQAPTPTPDRMLGIGRVGVQAQFNEALSVNFDVNSRVGPKERQLLFNLGGTYRF